MDEAGLLNCSKHMRTTRKKTWNLFRKGFLERKAPNNVRDWCVKFRLKEKYISKKFPRSSNNTLSSTNIEKCQGCEY